MVIDAMDLLYQIRWTYSCLVTSDSDFTRLAMRHREEKKYVLGMGESQDAAALTRACNKFVHLNLIMMQARITVMYPHPRLVQVEMIVSPALKMWKMRFYLS